jgi:teichuronic acid exporter
MSAPVTLANPAAGNSQIIRLLSALGTLGGAEMVNRVTRILTAVALSRMLGPQEFGIAAIVLTSSEFIRIFTQTGIGARIISASDTDLDKICHAAYRLNCMLYGAILMAQLALAWPIAIAYGDLSIAPLIAVLALPYALFPAASVQVYRVQRKLRMSATAVMSIILISGDNLLAALFAFSGFGLWSIVIPKIVVAILWVVAYRKLDTWRPTSKPDIATLRDTWKFGRTVLLTELVSALRLQGDKLLLGQIVGLSTLGTYYFAFNAGLGITSALITACSAALLPYFTNLTNGAAVKTQFIKATGLLYALLLPIFALQIGLAPWYVPIVFGLKWASAVPLMMVLCASGIPFVLWRATSMLLRAVGKPAFEFRFTLALTIVSLGSLCITAHFGLLAIAGAQLVINIFFCPIFAFIALKHLSKEKSYA